MSEGKFLYRNSSGNFVEGTISLADYDLAARKGVRTSQVINAKYPDADPQLGSAWQQGMRSAGVFPHGDKAFGIPSTTIRDAMTGECSQVGGLLQMAGNSIVAPSVPVGSSTPTSRLFLPEVITDLVESNLQADYDTEVSMFERMIADNLSIAGPVFTLPTIDTTAPREHDSRPIAQNALPRNLVSISASQSSKTIATESIGLQISDQAMQLSTLSLVQIIMNQQMMGAKYRMLWAQMSDLINGNVDAGESALSAVDFKTTYDTTAAANTLTHKGWLKALYQPERIYRYDSLICTIDGYLDVLNRTGRPLAFDPATATVNSGNAGTYGLDVTLAEPANYARLNLPFVFLIPSGILPDYHVLLLDSSKAIRKVTNTLASYTATEALVLQRSNYYRVDFGFLVHRIFTDAFKLLDYTN